MSKCPVCKFDTHYVPEGEEKKKPYIMKWLELGGCRLNYPDDKHDEFEKDLKAGKFDENKS